MNHKSGFTVFCILIITLGLKANGTDYYLSPAGNDSASGTSPEKAWKSIGKVNATIFRPGDNILFKAGETFAGSLKFDMADSGKPDTPVTVSSYGKGQARICSGTGDGLYAKNTSGFIVKDLIFNGAGADVDGRFSGICFFTDLDTEKPEHIRIDNVDVSG